MDEKDQTILMMAKVIAALKLNETRLVGEIQKGNEIIRQMEAQLDARCLPSIPDVDASISAKAEPEVPEVQLASAL